MITESQVQEALNWMLENEDSKISSNMSVAARETEALANEEYKTHLDNLRIAEEQYLRYEYKMDHNKLICQLWQTISANKRQSI